jgi:hypothetical protein
MKSKSPKFSSLVARTVLSILPTLACSALAMVFLGFAPSAFAITGLEPVSRAVLNAGGIYVVTPQGTGTWTATSNVSWIVLGGSTGTPPTLAGSGATGIIYTVNTNSSAESRVGVISVAGYSHTITQSGQPATLTASTPSTFTYAGGAGTVAVALAAGTAWTAASNDTWITVTEGATGVSSGSAAYAVSVHDAVVTRTGSLRIAGQTFPITQTGRDVVVTPTSVERDANSGIVQIQVSSLASTNWQVTPNAAWLSVVGTSSGSGDATVTIGFSSNPSYLPRTGMVKVGSATFTVVQSGTRETILSLSPTAAAADPSGGAGNLAVSATPDLPWASVSSVPWLIIASGLTGSGNGNIGFVATPNPTSSSRTGTIIVNAPPLS